ncbi:MAG: monovalent cation/H(+) antiporter subunit G [Leptospira sp.]|nr:monovalent cation/H(+) antiporter subunit G [Leptospira sp.]
MTDILIIVLSTLGAVFVLLAGVGILRMPDFYLRISVTTKAGTLGVGLILIANAFYFQETSVTSRALAIVVFLILTAPVAAHMIGRAGYLTGMKLWDKSVADEMKDTIKK